MSAPRRRVALPPPQPFAVIEGLSPQVDGGAFPAKAIAGDPLTITARVFAHGHEHVRAFVRHRGAGTARAVTSAMAPLGNDAFSATLCPEVPGALVVEVLGEVDHFANWRHDAERRVEAGVFELDDALVGAALVRDIARKLAPRTRSGEPAASATGETPASATGELREIAAVLRKARDAAAVAAALLRLEALEELLAARPPDTSDLASVPLSFAVQRELAACSAWYECFPRSTSPDPDRAGTLRDLIGRLDYIADLGFDICYLPPIHPIGRRARKGRNNSPHAEAGDVGSPWAIGAEAGGHLAIAPELGTLEDFDLLVQEAARRGIEIALDLAFQCSPDHPWVTEHPEWFRHRADGTIACAENPPKRYEDVYPLDFSTPDRDGLYRALLEVVRFWLDRGVRTFRVDNPHTKPFELWEWLITAVHEEDPGVIFLAEAFTRPAVMHRLAKVGFDQSYTYFTWRDTKWELTQYLGELANGPGASYFRGNLWPNTPDILAKSLQRGGRPSFVARLVLAACSSANYGIYGPVFELLEDRPVAPGSEEYLDSEKYEAHHHDLDAPQSIAPIIRRVNGARRVHPALRRNASLSFHEVDNEQLICFSKRDASTGDTILAVVNLDPAWTQSGYVSLDLPALGLEADGAFGLRDVLEDRSYRWAGPRNFVMLDPARNNAHLFVVERAGQ
ncbi:MAG: DUF3416 domain-containing protein [Actinomycetota bacterium]|nr:DUF3416 domain-containing protein [Actinomycetota bacterium]